ncbi:hypothetical protein SLS60_011100 [Paraconiothyrium brasiliense]|uniref:Protein kinase domain-containing protein n=1 Tax=Paraconiothyrium brasiliense TaxID=300254 RepID=A0ABR3QKJ9_9PLEO
MVPSKSPSKLMKATNGKYVSISHAGSGMTADIYFALPQKSLEGLKHPLNLTALRSQVCAIKLYKQFASRFYLKYELPAMKRLQDVPEELRARFAEPLNFCEMDAADGSYWYSMKAVNGFTLSQLRNTAATIKTIIPQELVFHVYLQLNQALNFLHTSDPPMVKGDLIAVNVMVDPSNQDTPGFPNIKLIDFGCSLVGGSYANAAMESERHWLYKMMYDLAMLNHRCKRTDAAFADADKGSNNCVHEIEFTDFVDALRQRLVVDLGLSRSKEQVDIDLQERIPKILKIKRGYASAESLQAIDYLVKQSLESSEVKFPTDQQILDAVGQVGQAVHAVGQGGANDTPVSGL